MPDKSAWMKRKKKYEIKTKKEQQRKPVKMNDYTIKSEHNLKTNTTTERMK